MLKKWILSLLFGPTVEELYYRSLSHSKKGGIHRYISIYLTKKIQKKFGCYLSPKATVGKGLSIKHPIGVVIGDGAIIGNDVTIFQNVTIGAARLGEGAKGLYPKIGNGVTIFAGAIIVGDIFIESKSIVGANAVVIKSCPKNSKLLGIPAKVH